MSPIFLLPMIVIMMIYSHVDDNVAHVDDEGVVMVALMVLLELLQIYVICEKFFFFIKIEV